MSRLTISIVLYNEENNIQDCLENLGVEVSSNQENVDILLIDNCSTDKSIEIIEKWNSVNKNARLIKRKVNNLGEARQEALEVANTPYIIFLDADSMVQEGWLKSVLVSLDDWSEDVGAMGGVSKYSTDCGWHSFAVSLSKLFPWGKEGGEKLLVNHLPTNNYVIHRDSGLSVGGFDAFFDRVGEDLDFNVRLSQQYKILFTPNFQVTHRLHRDFSKWLRKMSFYGRAQSFVLLNNRGGIAVEKFFPLLFSVVYSYFLLAHPINTQVVFLVSMLIPRLRFFTLSFLFYGFGEIVGLFMFGFKKVSLRNRVKRTAIG
jgi:glycosyltransferase involved in cell wall biosynthesis